MTLRGIVVFPSASWNIDVYKNAASVPGQRAYRLENFRQRVMGEIGDLYFLFVRTQGALHERNPRLIGFRDSATTTTCPAFGWRRNANLKVPAKSLFPTTPVSAGRVSAGAQRSLQRPRTQRLSQATLSPMLEHKIKRRRLYGHDNIEFPIAVFLPKKAGQGGLVIRVSETRRVKGLRVKIDWLSGSRERSPALRAHDDVAWKSVFAPCKINMRRGISA